jgi:omega-amidase
MSKLRVYAVQHDIAWEDKATNFARVESLLAEAAPQPASLIVLAEMFATGFSKDLSITKEVDDSHTIAFLRRLALHYQCCVIGGLIGCGTGDIGSNLAVAIAPDGSELCRYQKIQPFTGGQEDQVHAPGSQVQCFDFGGCRIAALICYDLRFPELARQAMHQGAEVLVYIASWPMKRQQHWVTLLQARAIENLAWVVGVNRCGTDPHHTYPGRSLVVDPHGIIIGDAADREAVLETPISIEVARQWRRDFPALRDAGWQQ